MPENSAIDVMSNVFTEEGMSHLIESDIRSPEIFNNPTIFTDAIKSPDEFVEDMDDSGVQTTLLAAMKIRNSDGGGMDVDIPYETVHEIHEAYPRRFKGLAGLNPYEGMDGVRELERAVEELGFVGALINPHSFGIPPNHRRYYPFYAKCAELDIPATITTGYTHGFSRNKHGKPTHVEDIALDFPDLTIVAAHTGWPWTHELVPIAWTNPNVYLGVTAYAPPLWDDGLVNFIKYRGTDKVLWGSDYPVTKYEKVFAQLDDVGLEEEHKRKLLHENPLEVYDLDE